MVPLQHGTMVLWLHGTMAPWHQSMMVPWYLMASYAYYKEDRPIFTDSYFDSLSKELLKEYDNIEHRHKELISKDALEAGTYLGSYPSIVKGALQNVRQQFKIS